MINVIMETTFNYAQNRLITMPVAASKSDSRTDELVTKFINEQAEKANNVADYASYHVVCVDDDEE